MGLAEDLRECDAVACESASMKVESKELDWHLGVGIQANALTRLSLARPDLEFRIWSGRLEIVYRDDDSTKVVVGWEGGEPTIADWRSLNARAAEFSVRAPA